MLLSWAYATLVATQLLKDDTLQANVVNQYLPLSLINPMVLLLSTRCTYACLFSLFGQKSQMGNILWRL